MRHHNARLPERTGHHAARSERPAERHVAEHVVLSLRNRRTQIRLAQQLPQKLRRLAFLTSSRVRDRGGLHRKIPEPHLRREDVAAQHPDSGQRSEVLHRPTQTLHLFDGWSDVIPERVAEHFAPTNQPRDDAVLEHPALTFPHTLVDIDVVDLALQILDQRLVLLRVLPRLLQLLLKTLLDFRRVPDLTGDIVQPLQSPINQLDDSLALLSNDFLGTDQRIT